MLATYDEFMNNWKIISHKQGTDVIVLEVLAN